MTETIQIFHDDCCPRFIALVDDTRKIRGIYRLDCAMTKIRQERQQIELDKLKRGG